MKLFLDEIKAYCSEKDFDRAIAVFRELDDLGYELPLSFCIIKSKIIQLTDSSYGYELDDVEKILQDVISRDGNYIDAYIELGYFYYAVADNSQKARDCFDHAIALSTDRLKKSLVGMAKTLSELGEHAEGLSCLTRPLFTNEEIEQVRLDIG